MPPYTPEQYKLYKRQYLLNEENRLRHAETMKRSYQKNKEKRNEKSKLYYHQNKEAILQKMKEKREREREMKKLLNNSN